MSDVIRTIVKLLDGPEGGNAIVNYPGEPPHEITVFRTQIAAPGVLVCAGIDNKHGLLPGDHLYRIQAPTLPEAPGFAIQHARAVYGPLSSS